MTSSTKYLIIMLSLCVIGSAGLWLCLYLIGIPTYYAFPIDVVWGFVVGRITGKLARREK